MIFQFKIGGKLTDYQVVFDYDADPFDFITYSQFGFLQNATLIERRLATVDRIRFYRLIAASPVEWQGSPPFYIDYALHYHDRHDVRANWFLRAGTPTELTDETHAAIKVWMHALHPVVVGTLIANRQRLHDEAKQQIRDQARQQATNMLETAKLMVGFLDELENGPQLIGFGDET